MEFLDNGIRKRESRKCECVSCPFCSKVIRFTPISLGAGVVPFFYCNKCSNVACRDEDSELMYRKAYQRSVGVFVERTVEETYMAIESVLPSCVCGGRFKISSNAKCPHCLKEIPYNRGIKNLSVRLFDERIVWIEGATVFWGKGKASSCLITG